MKRKAQIDKLRAKLPQSKEAFLHSLKLGTLGSGGELGDQP